MMMSIKFGKASAELTADEKAELAREIQMREIRRTGPDGSGNTTQQES
jgi:hypothetical protein